MTLADELRGAGYDESWFAAVPPDVALTVRLLHARMRALGLWRFVAEEAGSDVGTLHFRCRDAAALRSAAIELGFEERETSDGRWDSAERRARASLHLKHFADWPEHKVQAHIDPYGLRLRRAWWLLFPVPLFQMARHAADQEGYRDVERLRRLLVEEGLPGLE